MLSFFSKEKAKRFGLVALVALMIAAVPIFPGVRSYAPQPERFDAVSLAINFWLINNNLWEKHAVSFEVFYTDGIKENARYEKNMQTNKWGITLDPTSQRSYVPPYAGGGEGWGCPGTTASDLKPVGNWSWQGACIGEECSYGSPLFIVTGWESSGGVLQNCA
jgi:hypothetical protein